MNFRTLDLNLLRVFDIVMQERHVTRAAERLAMTQPAVSNALRRLRSSLEDELFIPAPGGVVPTRHALALWPAVRDALVSLQAVLEPAPFEPARDQRDFSIAMVGATAAVLMPPLVEHWRAAGVVSTLNVLGLETTDPRPLLDAGQADLVVGAFPALTQELEVASGRAAPHRLDPLYECRYVAVMRHDHVLAAKAQLSLDDYCAAQHLRVNFAGRQRGTVELALAHLGRRRRILLTVEHFSTGSSIVSRSDLLTVLPRSLIGATGFASMLAWRELPFELQRIRMGLLWHRRHEDDAAQRWLRDQIRRAAALVPDTLTSG